MSQHEDYTADQMDAIWVAYQTQGSALCPYCDNILALKLRVTRQKTGGTTRLSQLTVPVVGGTGPTILPSATTPSKTRFDFFVDLPSERRRISGLQLVIAYVSRSAFGY